MKQSAINQKTKWYYNPLDINFIKIHPFYKHFNTNYPHFQQRNMRKFANIARQVFGNSVQKLVILNVFIGQFWIFGHYRSRSMLFRVPLPSCFTVCSVQKFKIGQMKTFKITSLHRVQSVRTCSEYTNTRSDKEIRGVTAADR